MPARRPRRALDEREESPPVENEAQALPVSSLLPSRTWVLALLVGCGLLSWAMVVGIGAWLDLQQIDPWREIFGIRSGRFLRFYTTISLLTCSQLSYLILWRRSRSRKDFAGRYRVWFWVGAVCSVFCVATATQFHESLARQLTGRMSLIWMDSATMCWMVPATTMLLSAMHLMRRDMPYRTVSTAWVQVSRCLAIMAGTSLLIGSLIWPEEWVTTINAALSALWPAVFASTLLIHARYVTYVTNEASRERRQPSRTSRWESRLKAFARHVSSQASEEWHHYREKRASAKAAERVAATATPAVVAPKEPSPQPKRERRIPVASPSAMASAPLQQMKQRAASLQHVDPLDESDLEDGPAPATQAVNLRPLARRELTPTSSEQSVIVHPAQPIPPPHFEITEPSMCEEDSSDEREVASQSPSIPAGYTREQWRNLSKKDRKRLQRSESAQ